MTPSAYMTGTSTPAAMTRTWSTVPATRAQGMRGRPTTPASSTAATASPPPAYPAACEACPMVMATGMARPITIASMTRTVAQSRLIWAPSFLPRRPLRIAMLAVFTLLALLAVLVLAGPVLALLTVALLAVQAILFHAVRVRAAHLDAVRGEQEPGVPGGHDRPGDQHPGEGQPVLAGRVVGQAHRHLQGVVEPARHMHPLRPEHRRGQLRQLVRVHGPIRGVPGHHQLGDHRLHLVEDPGHVLVLADRQHPDDRRERERLGERLHRGFHARRVVRRVQDHYRAAPHHLEPPRRRNPREPFPDQFLRQRPDGRVIVSRGPGRRNGGRNVIKLSHLLISG